MADVSCGAASSCRIRSVGGCLVVNGRFRQFWLTCQSLGADILKGQIKGRVVVDVNS